MRLKKKELLIKDIKYSVKSSKCDETKCEGLLLPRDTTYDATELLNVTDSILTVACEIKATLEKGYPVNVVSFTIKNLHKFWSNASKDMKFEWVYKR